MNLTLEMQYFMFFLFFLIIIYESKRKRIMVMIFKIITSVSYMVIHTCYFNNYLAVFCIQDTYSDIHFDIV